MVFLKPTPVAIELTYDKCEADRKTFFFSSRCRHTRWPRDWSSDVCSSDLAVFTVLLHHFLPEEMRLFGYGAVGVKLFFVISGFLITGILLRCRQAVDAGAPARTALAQIGRASCRERE